MQDAPPARIQTSIELPYRGLWLVLFYIDAELTVFRAIQEQGATVVCVANEMGSRSQLDFLLEAESY